MPTHEYFLLSALLRRGGECHSSELLAATRRTLAQTEPPGTLLMALVRLANLGFITPVSAPIPNKGRLVRLEPSGRAFLSQGPAAQLPPMEPVGGAFQYLREMGLLEKPPNPKPEFDPHKLDTLLRITERFFEDLRAWQSELN